MYVLRLSEDNRVLSCGKAQNGVKYGSDMVFAKTAPDTSNGQWTEDYIYNKDTGEYTYTPVSRLEQAEPEPTTEDIMNAFLGIGGESDE